MYFFTHHGCGKTYNNQGNDPQAWKVNIIAGYLPRSFRLDFGCPRQLRHERYFLNAVKQVVVTCSTDHQSVFISDDLNSQRAFPCDLMFESNPCNHHILQQRCDISHETINRLILTTVVFERSNWGQKTFSAQFSSQIYRYHVTYMPTRGGTAGS